jgi:CTP synthase (UTP-ammonia lyase)
MIHIALIGDYKESVTAHRAIPPALSLAAQEAQLEVTFDWLHTATLRPDIGDQLSSYSGIWCVPASPYVNTAGALAAIRFARTAPRPFLGTCGGFQHALLEYAMAEWGIIDAAHAELDPAARDPLIAPLACSLVEVSESLTLGQGTRLTRAYGRESIVEGFHCRYGLNPRYAQRLEQGPLRVAARDAAGSVRAVELATHPFFVATLFQPERAALKGIAPPIVAAFLNACRTEA